MASGGGFCGGVEWVLWFLVVGGSSGWACVFWLFVIDGSVCVSLRTCDLPQGHAHERTSRAMPGEISTCGA